MHMATAVIMERKNKMDMATAVIMAMNIKLA